VLETRKKNTITRLTKGSKIIKTIINAIHEKKGENVISLDLRKIPEAVADFFIICEANNPSLLKAIADEIEHEVKERCNESAYKHEGRQAVKERCNESAYKHEGRQAQQWILIDYVNVVVHIMLPEPRKFYQLEEMWSDAVSTEHTEK